MIRSVFLCCLMFGCSVLAYAQSSITDSLASLFFRQLSIFPQEKIYLHTDKPGYFSGEKIWFRAYLTDAVTHIPCSLSRFVYVELINPLDSVVVRVKILEDKEAYHGYLSIPEDVPQGSYTLRAYTMLMRSQAEDYFFTKTLNIGDPLSSSLHTNAQFFFEPNGKVHATFAFLHAPTSAPVIPQSVYVSVNDGKPMNLKVEPDGRTTVGFYMPTSSRQRVLLLETTQNQTLFRQYIQVPAPDNDFDVTFFPEGGSLLSSIICKVAFKATKSDGQATEVIGTIFNQSDREVGSFKSEHLGMGSFLLLAAKGESYYAVCTNNKGQSKCFDLPVAINKGYALSINLLRNQVYVSVLRAGTDRNQDLYLLAHTRGMIHFVNLWDHEKKSLVFPIDLFPSGVLHLLLLDAHLHPVSERLVFIKSEDQAKTTCIADKEHYAKRSLVKNRVMIADSDGRPLTGSFSVSVTSDREVQQDSSTSILTQLLLTSDVRGYIENPAYYFQETFQSNYALDLLMCTQGWRRYDVAALVQGIFSYPLYPFETETVVSGTVKSMAGRRVEGAKVTVASLTPIGGYYSSDLTDKDGRFHLSAGILPDSTRYVVSVEPKRRLRQMNLIIDSESFPERTVSIVPPVQFDWNQFEKYVDKTEEQNIYENGIRVTQLSAAVVTAKQKAPNKSQYYVVPDRFLADEEINRIHTTDVLNLLQLLPNVRVQRKSASLGDIDISIRNSKDPPLLLVNDIPCSLMTLDLISIQDIALIGISGGASAAIAGMQGGGGIIVIHTREGSNISAPPSASTHIRTVSPLGYQQSVEFYAPKYDPPEKYSMPTSDLRTTIHWQPMVQTDSQGTATFAFYTADDPVSYTVTIEGVANDGSIIRKVEKISSAF